MQLQTSKGRNDVFGFVSQSILRPRREREKISMTMMSNWRWCRAESVLFGVAFFLPPFDTIANYSLAQPLILALHVQFFVMPECNGYCLSSVIEVDTKARWSWWSSSNVSSRHVTGIRPSLLLPWYPFVFLIRWGITVVENVLLLVYGCHGNFNRLENVFSFFTRSLSLSLFLPSIPVKMLEGIEEEESEKILLLSSSLDTKTTGRM